MVCRQQIFSIANAYRNSFSIQFHCIAVCAKIAYGQSKTFLYTVDRISSELHLLSCCLSNPVVCGAFFCKRRMLAMMSYACEQLRVLTSRLGNTQQKEPAQKTTKGDLIAEVILPSLIDSGMPSSARTFCYCCNFTDYPWCAGQTPCCTGQCQHLLFVLLDAVKQAGCEDRKRPWHAHIFLPVF